MSAVKWNNVGFFFLSFLADHSQCCFSLMREVFDRKQTLHFLPPSLFFDLTMTKLSFFFSLRHYVAVIHGT